MISFLSLPYELRRQIYDLSLLTPDIIYPYKVPYEEKYDPNVDTELLRRASPADLAIGLLGTNRSIRYETRRILYGKNTWHLSIGSTESKVRPSFSVFEKCFRRFRKNHVSFDVRDLSQEDIFEHILSVTEEWHELSAENQPEAGDPVNVLTNHAILWGALASCWQRKMLNIQSMRLDELTIDLKHAYCPFSCCKIHDFCIENEMTLGLWHRPIDSERGTASVQSNVSNYFWTVIDMDHIPKNLKNMKIIITGLTAKTKEVVLAHELGFACRMCKEKNGKLDVTDCEFLEQARLHIAWASDWKGLIRERIAVCSGGLLVMGVSRIPSVIR